MAISKKWITYGIAGVVGLSLVGGAAAATAANMDLQTDDGAVVPGGSVAGKKGDVLDRPGGVELRVTDTSVSVISAPSITQSAVSANSAPSVNSVNSVNSVDSIPTPVSVPSPASAPSAPSAQSAPSANSVNSAPSN